VSDSVKASKREEEVATEKQRTKSGPVASGVKGWLGWVGHVVWRDDAKMGKTDCLRMGGALKSTCSSRHRTREKGNKTGFWMGGGCGRQHDGKT